MPTLLQTVDEAKKKSQALKYLTLFEGGSRLPRLRCPLCTNLVKQAVVLDRSKRVDCRVLVCRQEKSRRTFDFRRQSHIVGQHGLCFLNYVLGDFHMMYLLFVPKRHYLYHFKSILSSDSKNNPISEVIVATSVLRRAS